ncbi:MAG: hypothetical protein ACE5I5_18810 [Candidatus Heimdallarchaeota archaeon]
MSRTSFYISVNRGYIILGLAIGVFLQLPIIYQLYFFYGATTTQFIWIVFGIPLAAAFFLGVIITNFAKTLTEKEQAPTLTIWQLTLSTLITAVLFYGIYLGVAPGLLRVFKLLDVIPFTYRTGIFELIALITVYFVIWVLTKT